MKGRSQIAPLASLAVAMVAFDTTYARGLRFDAPAERFTESCPLGAGRMGAMVFGRVYDERIVLNETGMWSGSKQDADRKGAAASLPRIRQLLITGKNFEAEQLVNRAFTCAGAGSGHGRGKSLPYGCYQTLGDLRINFHHEDSPVIDYRRALDFATACAVVEYSCGDVRYRREAFVSAPDEAFVLRISADRRGAVSFESQLTRAERAQALARGVDQLEMFGQLEGGGVDEGGVRFAARLRVIASGGTTQVEANRVRVEGADSAVLLVTAATDIRSFAGRAIDDARAVAESDMRRLDHRSFESLSERQRADHTTLYDRVMLSIGDAAEEQVREPRDHFSREVSRLFDYGRYLLISSSRPGGFPANLQGLWAEELQTPWNGDWHANVNVQMNYWPAEPCALSECHAPLFA